MDSVVKNMPRPVAVVVQTHWDREWYYPHQTFIARLLSVMARVVEQLESNRLTHFLFDGQTAAYEDLLANCEPDLAARVQKLVRDKRIILGPWYIMADEFLVSGESLIRNLEIGIQDATAAGHCQYVGYLPDTFGHIGQMPQILKNFAIPTAVMWRGVDSSHAEFNWQAPNGDVVGGVFLTEGYYQHPLNVRDWKVALNNYLSKIAPRAMASELLLTQGGDHLQSIDEIQARIDTFNAEQSDYQLFQSTLSQHAASVIADSQGKRVTIQGELRNNKQAFVLPDVLSTRRYLKRLNQEVEDRLLFVIEPLYAMLKNVSLPSRYIENTWRSVIQQQAHDSICGCSVDLVHREMVSRYININQRLDALIARASDAAGLISMSQHDGRGGGRHDVFADDSVITLFNPLPQRFVGKHIVHVFLRGEAHQALSVTTTTGETIAAELISRRESAIFRSPTDDFPDRIAGFEYTLLIDCNIAGLSSLALSIQPCAGTAAAHDDVMCHTIENEFLRVTVDDNGELSITNRQTGETTTQFLSFLSELDAGDSYNFSPPPHQHQVWQTEFAVLPSHITKMMSELRLAVSMTLPQGLNHDRQRRHSMLVTNRAECRLRLLAGQPMLDIELRWMNNAHDQRTRLLLSIPCDITHTYSDVAFDWVKRPVMLAAYPSAVTRTEMPPVVNPSLTAIQAGKLMFAHRAMQEYEVIDFNQSRYLGVTLIRSVGWMSRRDLVTRGVGAGPDMETPDAQCVGDETFHFQIGFAATDDIAERQALVYASGFRKPPVMLRGHTDQWRNGIEIDNPHLQLSSLRRIKNEIEMRLWNPTPNAQHFSLGSGVWRRVMANGTLIEAPVSTAEPHEIVTLRCDITQLSSATEA
jgi:mannosylglycerate hydrolase